MTQATDAFKQLVQENKGIIYKVCKSFCDSKEDRDDLAQEILYNLWKSFPTYQPDYKVSTWMYRVAMNVAISFYRKEKRAIQFTPYSEEILVFEDDVGTEQKEIQLRLLYQFIHELKELDRSIMLLYLDGKSYEEMNEITGLSETNIGTRIGRIKDKLKTRFTTQKIV